MEIVEVAVAVIEVEVEADKQDQEPLEKTNNQVNQMSNNNDWSTLSQKIHNELNEIKRDNLVPYVISLEESIEDAGDLYEKFLIDVQMSGCGTTSIVKEAISAVQLFFHRYFINLETVESTGTNEDDNKEELKSWWKWLRNYRVWEANRKVFLYPENYLRPELRDTKTPQFKTLEEDLLQGEMTEDLVEQAYKSYLDDYTEVSRLIIAGGYVYDPSELSRDDNNGNGDQDQENYLVLFGRTKTDPKRYFYRTAIFKDDSSQWNPWLSVDLQIDSDRVYPIYAFGRIFVFWAKFELLTPDIDTEKDTGANKEQAIETVKIFYSFYNLNKKWFPPQQLKFKQEAIIPSNGLAINDSNRNAVKLSDVQLFVEHSQNLSLEEKVEKHNNIVITSTYKSSTDQINFEEIVELFQLTPELEVYASESQINIKNNSRKADLEASAEIVKEEIFAEEKVIQIPAIVFNNSIKATNPPWFSMNDGSGSFLCKPEDNTQPDDAKIDKRIINKIIKQFPREGWGQADAQVKLSNNIIFLFKSKQYIEYDSKNKSKKKSEKKDIDEEWGKTKIKIAAGLQYENETYLFSGDQYLLSTGNSDELADAQFQKTNEDEENGISQFINDFKYLPKGWDRIDASLRLFDTLYFFNNTKSTSITFKKDSIKGFIFSEEVSIKERWGQQKPPQFETQNEIDFIIKDKRNNIAETGRVDAGFFTENDGNQIHLFSGDQYFVYSHNRQDGNPEDEGYATIDDSYPKSLEEIGLSRWNKVDAALALKIAGNSVPTVYLFNNERQKFVQYSLLGGDNELSDIEQNYPLAWRLENNLTKGIKVDKALADNQYLYLFSGDQYFRYRLSAIEEGEFFVDDGYPKQFQKSAEEVLHNTVLSKYEIIRLTTSTADELNERLFTGGISSLLRLETQKDEKAVIKDTPTFLLANEGNNQPGSNKNTKHTIKLKEGKVQHNSIPIPKYIDFNSANGIYYWEIFFHAPFLIAQSLNTGQKFEEAKTWYEYIFDPTDSNDLWQFFPFQPFELIENERGSLETVIKSADTELKILRPVRNRGEKTFEKIQRIINWVKEFKGDLQRDLELSEVNEQFLDSLADLSPEKEYVIKIRGQDSASHKLLDTTEKLSYRYKIRQNKKAQIDKYLKDPFDPHAIAAFRHIAYQKAIVMAYVDNILDWGDMLFRRYSIESINEARMLYILAYDLLGKKPEYIVRRSLPDELNYEGLKALDIDEASQVDSPLTKILNPPFKKLTDGDDDYDFLVYPQETPNASVLNPYFSVPTNDQLIDYWNRIEDRLYKIRQCQNILGISQPLPLFEPPIDPMALVQAVSSGASLSSAMSSLNIVVPHYRFSFMLRKAQDLVAKVSQLGNELLSTLEKKDAEELSRLQNRQEGIILNMTRSIKEAQFQEAQATTASLEESRKEANNRLGHYEELINTGLLPTEILQIASMTAAAISHGVSTKLKIGAAILQAVPDTELGGIEVAEVSTGGSTFGDAAATIAEIPESIGEALAMVGEVFGIGANHERMAQDWKLQKEIAASDIIQIGEQLEGAKLQEKIAEQEIKILEKEIEHNESIKTFMTGKFTNAELYQWMASNLSGIYYQTYQMAYDLAKSAEKAFQFELGLPEGEVNYISGTYWDSQRKGLLAGDTLGLDLDRMEKAYIESDSRGFEISKHISLLELDPVAFLTLITKGVCEFAFTEAFFDYDFPGHYARQLKTISLTFDAGEGQTVMATLTQLNHKTVLKPDPKAVKFLLDPKDQPPLTIRRNWRAHQQIALSHVDEFEINNGLFELRFDSDRYLPFEGTGAISNWRLQLNGKKDSYNVNDLLDITVNLKYTAEQGGSAFAKTVKGMLKPYQTERFFDINNEFFEQWTAFLQNDTNELVLPLSRDLFPNMGSSRISGIYAKLDLFEPGEIKILLDSQEALALRDNQFLMTPNLTINSRGTDLVLIINGDKNILRTINLVMGYQATVD